MTGLTEIVTRQRPDESSAAGRTSGRLRIWPIAVGMLLLQLVWLLVIPPFRGIDEFDHAYRAASVARGDWAPEPTTATRGTGAWVEAPSDLVKAAFPECDRLFYTGPEMCVGTPHGDLTTVASGAGRYNPVYYFFVGTPAKFFSGTDSLYVMRLVSVLACWGLFVLALAATRRWARSRWPLFGIAVASTPVLVYSTQVVAPNGIELLSAMVFWSALTGLLTVERPRREGLLFAAAAAGGALLVTVRSLGPLWCVLIVVASLIATPDVLRRVRSLLRLPVMWMAMGAVGAAAIGNALWTLSMGSLTIGKANLEPYSAAQKMDVLGQELPRWFFQNMAAFPLRDQPSHPIVYGAYFVIGVGLVGWGVWYATARLRLAMLFVWATSVAIPVVTTWQTIETYGRAWQGRYGLPFSMGLVLLAALALDRRQVRVHVPLLAVSTLVYVTAQALAPLDVFRRELDGSPQSGTSAWLNLPPIWMGLLCVIAASMMWLGALFADRRSAQEVQDG